MERIRVSTLAKGLGTSTTTIYKHMKRLDQRLSNHITKDGGVTFITTEGVGILKASIQATTISPAPSVTLPVPVQTHTMVDLSPIVNRLESMERGFMVMVEEIKGLKQENAALRLRLEPPPLPTAFHETPKPVKAWTPTPKPDPLEGAGIFERAWIYLVQPEKLRRCSP